MLISLIALPIIGSIVIMNVRTEALMRVLDTLISLLTFFTRSLGTLLIYAVIDL